MCSEAGDAADAPAASEAEEEDERPAKRQRRGAAAAASAVELPAASPAEQHTQQQRRAKCRHSSVAAAAAAAAVELPAASPPKRQRRGAPAAAAAVATEQHRGASGRPVRQARLGVTAALQAVANHGMPAARASPRRAAAAGAAAAAAAAAEASPAASLTSSAAAGEMLLELAAQMEAESPAASPASSSGGMRPELAAAREAVLAVGDRTRLRIFNQLVGRGEPKPFGVGSVVLFGLPERVRSTCADPAVACRVVKVFYGRDGTTPSAWHLRTNWGVLAHGGKPYRATPDEVCDGAICAGDLNFTGTQVQGQPLITISGVAAEMAKARMAGAPAPPLRCACKSGCGPRCPCRQAGKLCSRYCAGHSKNCTNWNEPTPPPAPAPRRSRRHA